MTNDQSENTVQRYFLRSTNSREVQSQLDRIDQSRLTALIQAQMKLKTNERLIGILKTRWFQSHRQQKKLK